MLAGNNYNSLTDFTDRLRILFKKIIYRPNFVEVLPLIPKDN